jgi:hypothetical protein
MTTIQNVIAGTLGMPVLSQDGRTIKVHIPITMRRRGGRKQVVTPADAATWIPHPSRMDNTLVKAVVRAHRWREMLEAGRYATVRDLAKAEGINESYLSRVLRLTLLAPRIVEDILKGRQPAALELGRMLKPIPAEWEQQLNRAEN